MHSERAKQTNVPVQKKLMEIAGTPVFIEVDHADMVRAARRVAVVDADDFGDDFDLILGPANAKRVGVGISADVRSAGLGFGEHFLERINELGCIEPTELNRNGLLRRRNRLADD